MVERSQLEGRLLTRDPSTLDSSSAKQFGCSLLQKGRGEWLVAVEEQAAKSTLMMCVLLDYFNDVCTTILMQLY